MSLKNKLKEASKAIILSAAIASAAGCATQWQAVRTNYEPNGKQAIIAKGTEYETETKREFYISDFDSSGIIRINETKKEKTYQINKLANQRELEEVLIEQREVTKPIAILTPLLIAGLGAYVGNSVEDGALPGFFIGLGIGTLPVILFPSTETRSTKTGGRKTEVLNEKTERSLLNESISYTGPARNIAVNFSSKLGNWNYETDDYGNLSLSDIAGFLESSNPNLFLRDYSSKDLENRVGNIPLVQQIKSAIKTTLMNRLIKEISRKDINFTIGTAEKSSNPKEQISNASRNFGTYGNYLSDDSIYKVVKQFVDEKINSSIMSLEFTVKDDLSHAAITGCNFELAADAPSKLALAGKYFTGNLTDFAVKYTQDYLTGSSILPNCSDKVKVRVYSPSNLSLEVTNPNYYFVAGKMAVKGNAKKTIYMVDKGSKVRIEVQKESMGRIEDSP